MGGYWGLWGLMGVTEKGLMEAYGGYGEGGYGGLWRLMGVTGKGVMRGCGDCEGYGRFCGVMDNLNSYLVVGLLEFEWIQRV